MFYIVYKITNLINDKIYIGAHKTTNIDDDYMGSGKILKRSIKKHGLKNFKKEILEVFDNPEEMFEMESKLVNGDFIKNKKTYNIKEGGSGGWDYINTSGIGRLAGMKGGPLGVKKQKQLSKLNPHYFDKRNKNLTDGIRKAHKEGKYKYDNFSGKTHKEESKNKIGKANSKHQTGSKNSQYGTCWIYNESNGNKKIPKTDLKQWLNKGWIKGRKIKTN